jgi:hypothetical protein
LARGIEPAVIAAIQRRVAALGLILARSLHPAEAHISYSNRNFGTWSGSTVTGNNGTLADGAVTILGQTLSSSLGWADATDLNWCESHRMRAYRFTLSAPATYGVSVSVSAVPQPTGVAFAAAGLGSAAWLAARRRRLGG